MAEESALERAMDLLSYNDMRIVESKSGVRLAALQDEASLANLDLPAVMHAMHYVVAKRENPNASWEEIGDLNPSAFNELLDRLAPKDED